MRGGHEVFGMVYTGMVLSTIEEQQGLRGQAPESERINLRSALPKTINFNVASASWPRAGWHILRERLHVPNHCLFSVACRRNLRHPKRHTGGRGCHPRQLATGGFHVEALLRKPL
jgi:hypothetical protein